VLAADGGRVFARLPEPVRNWALARVEEDSGCQREAVLSRSGDYGSNLGLPPPTAMAAVPVPG
jgi:hypothetical protein